MFLRSMVIIDQNAIKKLSSAFSLNRTICMNMIFHNKYYVGVIRFLRCYGGRQVNESLVLGHTGNTQVLPDMNQINTH